MDDIVITAVNAKNGNYANGVFANGEGAEINIHANNLNIQGYHRALQVQKKGVLNIDSGTTGSIVLKSEGKNPGTGTIDCGTGIININAKTIDIIHASNGVAIASEPRSGTDSIVTINASDAITIQGDIIAAYESNLYKGIGHLVIDSPTAKTQITGNVQTKEGSDFRISLSGEESFLKGAIDDSSNNSYLELKSNAFWEPTDDSNINDIFIKDGIIKIKNDIDIQVNHLSGSLGRIYIEDSNTPGSFTANESSTDTIVNIQATNAQGKVKNAEEITATRLDKLREQIHGVKYVTAFAPEGDVAPAYHITQDGTVITDCKNSLMDAVLQQASVTTVALDKILTNDVRKRLGDIRSDANTTGVWMRWDGGKLKGDGGLTNNFNTIQIGGDTKVAKNCRLGVAGSFTHGDTDFARGNGELEGFSFAAYATWMGENGMFADVVARLGHFSTEMNVEGRTGDMDNRVASLSGEYGWRISLCDQFFVKPQIELAYTYVNSEDLKLGEAEYHFDNVDSLTGRAGLVAGWNLPNERGNVYARASVLQQFMGDAKISGSNGTAYNIQEIDGEDTWLEYGIGANIKLTDKTYIWADVERTEGADVEEEWRGTVGIRYSF